jgi:hypothetical protein
MGFSDTYDTTAALPSSPNRGSGVCSSRQLTADGRRFMMRAVKRKLSADRWPDERDSLSKETRDGSSKPRAARVSS